VIANAQERARALCVDMFVLWGSTIEEADAAFATLAERRVDAISLVTNVLFHRPP
jgi:hypothetical protein